MHVINEVTGRMRGRAGNGTRSRAWERGNVGKREGGVCLGEEICGGLAAQQSTGGGGGSFGMAVSRRGSAAWRAVKGGSAATTGLRAAVVAVAATSSWLGQGVGVVAAVGRMRAAAAATAVGLLPQPFVSSHSRGSRLLFRFLNDG